MFSYLTLKMKIHQTKPVIKKLLSDLQYTFLTQGSRVNIQHKTTRRKIVIIFLHFGFRLCRKSFGKPSLPDSIRIKDIRPEKHFKVLNKTEIESMSEM